MCLQPDSHATFTCDSASGTTCSKQTRRRHHRLLLRGCESARAADQMGVTARRRVTDRHASSMGDAAQIFGELHFLHCLDEPC